MIKSLHKFFMTAVLVNSLCVPYTCAEDEALKHVKKTAKIVCHIAEIFAGFYIGKNDFHWTCCDRISTRRFVFGVATVSLLVHGCLGLDKELKIVKKVKNFLK